MPQPTLMPSDRCRYRRLTLQDVDNMQKLESDPDVMKNTSIRTPRTREQTLERLKTNIENQKNYDPIGMWAVEDKTTVQFIGWVMLIIRELKYPELGYMVVQTHWGKGLATEIAGQVVDYGLNTLGLEGISACTDIDNEPSIRVLEKLHFQLIEIVEEPDKALGGLCKLKRFERTKVPLR